MELKEGMYVRTNCHGEIVVRKIVKIVEDTFIHDHYLIFDKPTKYTYYVKDNNFISKENLIDLIEVGDYVNGLRINSITEVDENHDVRLVWNLTTYGGNDISFSNEEIKSIVTKEQFNSVKYEVE